MAKKTIVEPVQKRSIEKKDKIVRTCLKLITEKGYHNITTDDIAKEAGISVGIVYRYFTDKKSILMATLSDYYATLEKEHFWQLPADKSLDTQLFLERILEYFIKLHKNHPKIHNELEALRYSDPDVARLYTEFENTIVHQLVSNLPELKISSTHSEEKIRLIVQQIEGFCHSVVLSHNTSLDYAYMKKEVIRFAMQLLIS